MSFIQARSFIATLTSTTPGCEGILDSVESRTIPASRCNNWLTVSSALSVGSQQRFWFGYYEGRQPGYSIVTVESEAGASHKDTWDLGSGYCVGYYPKVANPLLWRIRVNGQALAKPEVADYSGVTIAAMGSAEIGVRNRKSWEDCYVRAGAPIKLIMLMRVSEVNVPSFDRYAMFRRR
ncbi:hypothetical protein QSV36_20385 [Pseudomonas sp. BCRC 81390]|uniref:hypothetical protein n=1 Tax=Pseudomonas sp. BCRC 81390 TaxID=3054778 RepID=UPI0025971AF3|nr:hypothetical protein [Pseudomonas sp. BCRC 81390]MDM3887930.1 hypothetical protein [Pseudomonas sp. BCRC 81390]